MFVAAANVVGNERAAAAGAPIVDAYVVVAPPVIVSVLVVPVTEFTIPADRAALAPPDEARETRCWSFPLRSTPPVTLALPWIVRLVVTGRVSATPSLTMPIAVAAVPLFT